MLQPDIARLVRRNSELLTSVNDCFRKALHARYRLTQTLENKEAKKNEAKRKEACLEPKNVGD